MGLNLSKDGKTVIYARVSTAGQKDDLKNQIAFLRQYANAKGMIVDAVFEDVGSGLNDNRKKWNALIDDCISGEIKTIIIAHKDRFIRFGYTWFERFLKSNGVEIIVVNNEILSPGEEIVQDLISIIHVFSCRIDGLKKYKKWLNTVFIPDNSDFLWIKAVGSKAVKQSIMNAETAFRRFFKKQSGFPQRKKQCKGVFPQKQSN